MNDCEEQEPATGETHEHEAPKHFRQNQELDSKRGERKKHESENQDEALEEASPPAIRRRP